MGGSASGFSSSAAAVLAVLNTSKSPPKFCTSTRPRQVKMASFQFDLPVYVQRKHFIEEITNLYEVFDFFTNGRNTSAIFPMRRYRGRAGRPLAEDFL
ncbi:hypothetical protein RGR602_PC01312 (plasmid) [Rhizobium gallicum bv. gallicum R602sp]|uniref:Uncharacterized protein n=1 Tax=Rhizobium gallicum bv. gallicum R602sp TaxID=1041138 RepID=A0A0B4XBE7_9HYPH|nr:hypothetical protein RGR602_PC01312 [Rhizobium gallicum bv. gallicum R602sp]